jgi:hypothetical protein
LTVEVLHAILSRDDLRVEDEEGIYEIIRNRCNEDFSFGTLFQYIRFEYLSIESMASFLAVIEKSFDILTPWLWSALCPRLSMSVSPEVPNDRAGSKQGMRSIDCPFRYDSPLDGVIHYLTRKCKGNVHDRNVVAISASSAYPKAGYEPRQVADFEAKRPFLSDNKPNSWICYDFQERRIQPTHYTVRSRLDENYGHLRSWVLEGSADGKSWVTIDQREDNQSLASIGAIATFPISVSIQLCQVRLRQLSLNSNGNYWLELSMLELYGTLLEPEAQ